jgi:hypothetical protein
MWADDSQPLAFSSHGDRNSTMKGNKTNSATVHQKDVGTAPISFEDADCFDSWKEIAGYFHRSVRTVQRWERFEGMPVHRHSHGAGDSVLAYRHELNAWRASRSHPGNHPTSSTIGGARLGGHPRFETAALRTLLESLLMQLGGVPNWNVQNDQTLRSNPRRGARFGVEDRIPPRLE